jgi:MFS family permease
MNSLAEFYIAYCIVGAGVRAFGIMPAAKIVSNWFIKKRGTALGIATVSFGLGGFILSPIIGGYVIPTFGWRAAYLTLAFVALVLVIPVSALILKTKPSDMGLFPDGVKSADQVYKPAFGDELAGAFTLKSAVITSAFWLITISFMISNFSHMGLMQHSVIYLTSIGYPIAIASTALGNVGLFSALAKFVMGWLCDKIPAKFVATICFFFTYMFWLYAFSMGFGVGGWTTSLPILLSGNFGLKYYGAILGMFTLVSGSLAAFGPQVASIVYDNMGSYVSIFWAFFALSALSVPLMLFVRRPKNIQPAAA